MLLSRQAEKLKVEYNDGADKRIKLFEVVNNKILETIFDCDGAVMRISILQGSDLESALSEFLNSLPEKIDKLERTFEEIKLKKQCPHCDSDNLVREIHIEKNQVPIAPIYECKNCGGRSYHLTPEYLQYLVLSHKELFEEQELHQLKTNEKEFFNELSEYIVRIFASKRIKRIR
ncbi:MAG: hypothetical protein M1124_00130 [Candidatus Marsarchaeota archaeon]|nr:hypothetical protein [Candidatus Marsarchaeota archaeon]